jgi:tRNA pseudouridine55 synthase
LLVLLVGRVTRLASYMAGEPKTYEATIRFGSETDTDDLTGTTIRTAPIPDEREIRRVLPTLTGAIDQQPPTFSAKQVGGVRSYAASRRGKPIALRPARVTVHEWALRRWHPPDRLDVTVTCSGGTYVRALARDLGRLAGSAAHLTALRRIRSGPFDVADAAPPDAVDRNSALRSPLLGLAGLPVISLEPGERERIVRGQSIGARAVGDRVVLVDFDEVVALAVREGDLWAPRVVMRDH